MFSKCCLLIIVIQFFRASILIDPEYVMHLRLQQIVQAVANTIEDNQGEKSTTRRDGVTFWCANSKSPNYRQVYHHDPNVTDKINFTLPMAFLIHGWFDSVNRTWMNNTIAAYVKHVNSNICGVDWSRLALTEYTIAANNTKTVARYLSKFITFLRDYGLNLNDVTLIGHSMGSHIAGMTGAKFGGNISTIIGLDPAGWFFTKPALVHKRDRLDKSDAQFVQCIHTNMNYFGLGSDTDCGHQDFYPNGGFSPQPGCYSPAEESGMTYTPLICSHYKAVQYFQYSLNPKNEFMGYSCTLGYHWWDIGACKPKTSDTFGLFAKKHTLGQLFFRTSVHPPFSLKG